MHINKIMYYLFYTTSWTYPINTYNNKVLYSFHNKIDITENKVIINNSIVNYNNYFFYINSEKDKKHNKDKKRNNNKKRSKNNILTIPKKSFINLGIHLLNRHNKKQTE